MRWLVLLLLSLSVAASARPFGGGTSLLLDQYYGVASNTCPNTSVIGTLGYFNVQKLGSHWIFCDPLSHPFFMFGVYSVNDADAGSNYSNIITPKYGSTANWAANVTRRLLQWGFNVISPYSGYGSADMYPVKTYSEGPNPNKIPFLLPTEFSGYCISSSTYKLKTVYNGMKNPSGGTDFPDVWDPNWVNCIDFILQKPGGAGLFASADITNQPLIIGIWGGDTDYLSGFAAGPNSQGHYAGNHVGQIYAVSSPVQATCRLCGSAYSDSSFYGKKELEQWVQGTAEQTTGVSAARSGSTVTYTMTSNPYGPNDVLTVTGCSDATFDSVAGTGVKITSLTSTTAVVTLSGAGSSATGCTLGAGPGYTLSALNTAWGSSYTSFGTTGSCYGSHFATWICPTPGAAASVGTGDGTTTTFTTTLANLKIDPSSLEIFVAGSEIAGDTGAGGIFGASGSINYTTGALSITFTTAPASGAAITAEYMANGWDQGGTGLMDESGSTWMPTQASNNTPGTDDLVGGNAQIKTDLDNFMQRIANKFFGTIAGQETAQYPNYLKFGPGDLDAQTWSQVLAAVGYFMDVPEISEDPQYVNGLANAYNVGGKPYELWMTLQSTESDTTSSWTPVSSTCAINSSGTGSAFTYTTQNLRGQCYQALLNYFWNSTGTDGNGFVMGINWWEMVDKVTGGENADFGLVSQFDNPYNGTCDVTATVTGGDNGYNCGGDGGNYTNFIGPVIQENQTIMNNLAALP